MEIKAVLLDSRRQANQRKRRESRNRRDVYFHLIYGRLNSTVQQERMSQLDIDTENKCILDLNLAQYKKVNSRWLVDLHVKWKTMKPLKEKHISAFS